MLTKDFLNTVITSTTPGYFCLALSNGSGAWLEEWHRWPDDVDKIIGRAEKMQHTANVYFSSYLFRAPQSTKENVLPSRTIQADLDDADLNDLPREPAVLVETSPGRHQAYWILSTPAPTLEAHEEISRKITYSIPLCDRSGWPLGRKVRLPDTLNHKYLSGVKPVRIVRTSLKQYEPEEFEALPEVPQFVIDHYDNSFIENPLGADPATTADTGLELLEAIRPNIPMRVYLQYSVVQADRSEALWALMCWGFKAGLSRGQVFTLARDSANNKFRDLKHRADQDLAKDVLRAEHAVNSNQQDARALIQGIFKTDLPSVDKKRQIFNIVLSELKGAGEFIRTRNGLSWYVRRDVGRPVSITTNSEALHTMLDVQFGMNFTEPETKYVVQGLKSYTGGLPETSVQSALSYYDPEEQHLLIHTGRRDVLRVTRAGMEHGVDGSYNVIFPWSSSVEPFIPAVARGGDIDWGEELFGKGRRGFGTAVENITNMTPSQAKALLQVWLMFVLFRNIADTRPIIASLGQPGSGKTTLFKRVYTFLYGRRKSIGAVTDMDDFDQATSSDPLVILDNVDTWERWLPDRIALSAGTSDVIKRKLYTDTDTITLSRQAVVGVTAHNPKFGREDVADRFLLFTYKRLRDEDFIAEGEILADIYRQRNALWGAVLRDIQKVLSTPMPDKSELPHFRIEDFARFGLWMARALGVERDFRASIEDVKTSQQAFSLEEEGMLVAAIMRFVSKSRDARHYTTSQLWAMLENCCDDPRMFGHVYKNSVQLSKKISAMQQALRRIVRIEQSTNDAGNRTWLITQKEEHNGADADLNGTVTDLG